MKVILTTVWGIICVVILFYGHSYWSERTEVQTEMEKHAANSSIQGTAKSNKATYEDILAKAQNWPKTAQQQFEKSLKEDKPFKILFVGSAALGAKDQGMLKDVVQELNNTYGDHVTISIHTYNGTSMEFVANKDQQEIAAEKAQLIVFEPFLLNDNGKVAIEDSLTNLTTVMEEVKTANPDAVFILQPSYPLFGAKHYPGQVDKLKQYAEQNNIAYLDHWTAWPDYHNKQFISYLSPDQSGPSEKGIQVWSQYLIRYLIHE